MTRLLHVLLLACVAAGAAAAQDVVFKKSLTFDNQGGVHKVELLFRPSTQEIVLREKANLVAQIPYGAVKEFSYEFFHRPFGKRKHWFSIHYRSPEGWSEELVLSLDEGERKMILATATAQTGKDVVILPPKKK